MKDLKTRGTMAASRFLTSRGYDVLEEDWKGRSGSCEIIALDGDALVFAKVKTRSDAAKGFPTERNGLAERAKRETVAIEYLTEHPEIVDISVRFDTVSLLVTNPNQALIRHHINCMGGELMQPDTALPEAA